MAKSSEKQQGYIMMLLKQKGFSTRYIDRGFKALGLTMRERSGNVEDWVEGLSKARASEVIDKLNEMVDA